MIFFLNVSFHNPNLTSSFTKYLLTLTHRVIFGLEGGYDLKSLGKSVVETIGACLNLDSTFTQ